MVGLDPLRRRKSRWYGVTIRPPRRRETSSPDTIIVRNESLGLSIDCETATAHWHGERIDYDHALMVSMASWDSGDTDMALRVLGYVVELYRDLEAQGVVRSGTRRPPVVPVVVHNGESPWRAPVQVAELIALPRMPAQVRRDLRALQPSQRLHVVDFPRYRQDDLVPGNVVSLQIGFEHAGPSDYARLLPAVAELSDAGLRRTVYEWVVRRARRDGVELEEVNVEGTYFRSRIGDNFRRATRAWFEEGRAEGRVEGIEEGLEQQRVLLGGRRPRSSG